MNRRGQRENDLLDHFFLLRLQGDKQDMPQPQPNQALLRENLQNCQTIVPMRQARSPGRDPETKRTDVLEVQEPNAFSHAGWGH